MNKIFIIFSIVFASLQIYSQDLNNKDRKKDFTYISDFEKKYFSLYLDSNRINYLALFLCSDPEMNDSIYSEAQKVVDKIVKEIRPYVGKNNKKIIVQRVYKAIHNGVLRKYERSVPFHQIFVNGHFNCVTSSALYGIILTELNIPFVIQQKPEHVLVIAYPGKYNIAVETTSPVGGYHEFDKSFQYKYVNSLLKAKLITNEDIASKGKGNVFNENYYTQDQISLKELIGLHYKNLSNRELQQQKFLEAFDASEKAFLFYQGQRSYDYLLYLNQIAVLYLPQYNESNIKYLIKLEKYKTNTFDPYEFIESEFSKIFYQNLKLKNDEQQMDMLYNIILEELREDSLKKEINFSYYNNRAKHYYTFKLMQKSYDCFDSALNYQPNNLEVQFNLIKLMPEIFKRLKYEDQFKEIISINERHKTLSKNPLLLEKKADILLNLAKTSFEDQNISQGNDYLNQFELLCSENQDISFSVSLMEDTYTVAAAYYLKKRNHSLAKSYFDRGLIIIPESQVLKINRKATYN